MSLGPPPPHQRPPMSSGLPGAMGSLSLGPPSGAPARPPLGPSGKPLSSPMPFSSNKSPFPPSSAPGPLGPPGLKPNGHLNGQSPAGVANGHPPAPGPSMNSLKSPLGLPPNAASISSPAGGHSGPFPGTPVSKPVGMAGMAPPGGPLPTSSKPVVAGGPPMLAPGPSPMRMPTVSTAGGSSQMPLMSTLIAGGPPSMPLMSTPGASSPSMAPMSTPGAWGAPSMPPMSTPGPSPMPFMSTPGGPSTPMGMPTLSTPGNAPSPMPPMSTVGGGGPPPMGIPTVSTPGGSSLMPSVSTPGGPPTSMPPMSTPGGAPSPMGMPSVVSTPGGAPSPMPPMSTPGPAHSPMGMPPMSTPGGPSTPMGMPPMSTPGGPSPMGMPPMSTPGGPSPMGMPPMSTPGGPSTPMGMPPMSTPGGPSTPMGMPPMSTPGGPNTMGMPPMVTPGGPNTMGMPPMSTPGGPNTMGMPPMVTPGGPNTMGMPPMSTPGGPNTMGMSTPGGPNTMGMPPMSTPGGPPTSMGVTPMSTPGGPPTSMGVTPMSTLGGPNTLAMPPMSTPGGPPTSMGMPPMSTPGGVPSPMPPRGPMSALRPGPPSPMGSMPPHPMSSNNTPGRFPPMSTPGAPPMMNPGSTPNMMNPGSTPNMMNPGSTPNMMNPGGYMPPSSGPGPMPGANAFPPRSPGNLPPPHNSSVAPGMNAQQGFRPGGYPGMNNTPVQGGMMGAQPGYPPQSGFGPGAAPGKRALDPDNMPSPITVMEEDSKNNSGYFDTREKGLVPPLVTTKFVVRDCGNSSPRYVRSTMYHVPATPDLMKQCGVPFGLVISPLASIGEGESEPAVTDFGSSGPVRCVRCKAYMCPFMQFVDGGRRFQCVFCKATTEVPQEYFQHLDHNGMRLDHYQRPELCMGTYEVLATKEYCRESTEPLTPGIIFAIDVSYPMIKEGIVSLLCQNMKELLRLLPRDNHCDKAKMKVGFMAYDNKINFYNINGVLSQPQQMTVSDVHDMFVPLVDGFMVDLAEAESVIDSLMEQIPVLFGETRETETMLGPVIQAGKEAFKAAKCAGKLVVFHHNLPICDAPGKLKNRDDRKLLNTEKEKSVLSPQSKFYNELGQECVSVGCSVDLFLFNNAYIDVATLSQVSRLSGGQMYKYTYFQPELDGERFLSDLRHNIQRPVAFDSIMRVRTSTGVRPVDFFGSFFMANSTDTELASINSDMSVACEIKHDDKLTDEDGVYIQVALLFTSCSGQRRLRIMNLSLNTGTNLADMYRSCDLDTIINFTGKQSISRIMESNPKTVKEALINNCAQILACYRRNCASQSSIGQLILPECMKLLPLYTNCLIKSDALVGGVDVGCDERAFLMSIVSSMDVRSSMSFFYPSLIPIHDVNPEETHIPKIIRCSYEKIRDDGVYLLENGLHIFMYIGLGTDPSWVRDIFGVESPAQIDVEKVRFESAAARDNPLYKRVAGIIHDLRARRPRYMRLFFVRPKDKLDILFKHFLCEDRTGHDGNFSYVDFLCYMHKEIRALLG